MYVSDKFYQKGWLDLDAFENAFFESRFCEVEINTKYKILLSELTYRIKKLVKMNISKSLHRK